MDFRQLKYLFLDRDGVLNKRIAGDYVRSISQWEWLPGAKEAIPLLNQHFDRIVLVSNQQGVGKGYFSQDDLQTLTQFFLEEITQVNGKLDAAFYCTHLSSDKCTCRKPQIGLALMAQNAFPDIDFAHSLMVGDSLSDMEMGKNAGMRTIFVCTEQSPEADCIDEKVDSLRELAMKINNLPGNTL